MYIFNDRRNPLSSFQYVLLRRRFAHACVTYPNCSITKAHFDFVFHINKVNSSIIIRIAHKSSFATINQLKVCDPNEKWNTFFCFLIIFFFFFFFCFISSLNSYNKHSCNLFRILNAFLVIYHLCNLIYEYNINRF